MDQYIIIVSRNKTKYYYKNSVLHREEGPAIIHKFHQDKHLDLPDEHLYKIVEIEDLMPKGYKDIYVGEDVEDSSRVPFRPARYYLDGKPYSKKEFEQIKEKMDLKKELNNELNLNQINIQKVKI